MLTNLQNLPAGVWVAAILVLVVATAIGIWLYRKFELKKVTVKTPVVEAELERRPADKPVNTALPTTADQPAASINIRGNKIWGRNILRIRRQGTNVEDNLVVGENEIEVGDKPGPKPKNRGRKPTQ